MTRMNRIRVFSLILTLVLCLSVLPMGALADTSGWVNSGGSWYYYENGAPLTSQWKKSGSYWYYFDENGSMVANDYQYIDGHWYYFTEDGHMVTGWRYITAWFEDGSTYSYWTYFYSNGQEVDDGWEMIGGKWYYFHDGEMMTGWLNSDPTYYTEEQGTNGDWYYLDPETGAMITGWKQFTETYDDGTSFTYWAYFRANGKQVVSAWQQVVGVWYCFDDYGAMYENGVYQLDGNWYCFGASGAMQTGWKKISTIDDNGDTQVVWAYFTSSGAMKMNGWQWDGKNWYYFYNGSYYTGSLMYINSKYYFFNDSGAMHTGWKKLDGKWYYFQSSGAMKILGTLKIDGVDYAFIDGVMVTNRWFYQRYYGSNGAMLKNTSKTINGKYYTFDAKGVPSPYYFNPDDQYGTYGYLIF